MAKQRYYFTDNDYEFFIRIFPTVEKLSWFHSEQNGSGIYWYTDIDFENISKTDIKKLGDDYDVFLQRLKQQAKTAPPASESFQSPPPASNYSKTKRRRVKLKLSTVLVDALLIAIVLYSINIISEAESINSVTEEEHTSIISETESTVRNTKESKGRPHFMQLLRKTVNSSAEPEIKPGSSGNKGEPGYNRNKADAGVTALLSQCKKHIRANRFTTGEKGTALKCYHEVLRQSPGNPEAMAGLQRMEKQYIRWAKKALRRRNLQKVRQYLEGLDKVNPDSPDLPELKRQMAALRR
ncbi:MAG: hypothetical protein GY795_42720 [Desulfobacterales bacterium]|nr:hypothetical protein [Desulfobacterales bacterium]